MLWRFRRQWDLEVERSPLPQLGLRPDPVPTLLGDAITDAESKTASLPHPLGGKEGVEEPDQVLFRYTRAILLDEDTRYVFGA